MVNVHGLYTSALEFPAVELVLAQDLIKINKTQLTGLTTQASSEK